MRKIYQSAPDVPQPVANKAIDIIERHFAACGVRRAEDLPEESRVRLVRELQKHFQSRLPPRRFGREGEAAYNDLRSGQGGGPIRKVLRRLQRLMRGESVEPPV